MANILITGGAGYVGSTLAGAALAAGHRVTVVDLLWYDTQAPIVHMGHPDYRFVRGDIRDASLMDAPLAEADVVVHAAAVVGDPAAAKYPDLARQTNWEATRQLVDAVSGRRNVKGFIFLSTCSNYGVADGMATEESPLKPLSLYAETKVQAERHVMGACAAPWVVMRLSTVYGLSPRMRFDLTVNDFALNGWRNRMVDVFLPHSYRPYIHVRDLAEVLVAAASRCGELAGQVFNVGFPGENFQKIQIAEAVARHVPGMRVVILKEGGDKRDYQVDFSKIAKALGVSRRWGLDAAVARQIAMQEAGLIANYDDPKYYETTPNLG